MTYANVVATLALFIALGGSAYAAVKVTGRNVVDSSLTGKDVKNESLGSADVKGLKGTDFAAGQLTAGAKGATGATGATGAAGAPGSNGATGTNGTNGTDGQTGPAGPAGPGAAAHGPDAGQSISNATITNAQLSFQDFDTGGLYTPPNDEIAIVVPGNYLIVGSMNGTPSTLPASVTCGSASAMNSAARSISAARSSAPSRTRWATTGRRSAPSCISTPDRRSAWACIRTPV